MSTTVRDIQIAVAAYREIKVSDLTGPSHRAVFARPRQVAYALSLRLTSLPLSEIGRLFGGRDHSTVCSGINSMKRRNSPDEMALFEELGKEGAIPIRFTEPREATFFPAFNHKVIIRRNSLTA